MQFPNNYQQVLIIPTGQNSGQRIVIDGVNGVIETYDANNNLITSIAAVAGTDQYGNQYPQGLSVTEGVINGSTITGGTIEAGSLSAGTIGSSTLVGCDFQQGTMEETDITFDDGGGNLLLYTSATNVTTYNGSGSFVVPAGVTSIQVQAWGGGGGGEGGSGAGGGGGEYAAETALTVTPGETLTVTVGAGGSGGSGGAGGPGTSGGTTTLKRSTTALVTANGGQGGSSATSSGGSGSTNTIHFNGGGSKANSTGVSHGGAGGGSSAGTNRAGNTGGSNSGSTGGAGATAPTGGGNGGAGGNGTGTSGTAGTSGTGPGGGGGAGGAGSSSNSAGGNGAAGRVVITYVTAQEMIGSVSANAGTDAAGNSYPVGFMGTMVGCNNSSGTATPYTWQTPTAASSSWTVVSLKYRIDAEDNVVWSGEIDFSGATAITNAGSQPIVNAVPNPYRPNMLRRVPVAHFTNNSVVKNTAVVAQFGADGTVQLVWSDAVGTAHDANAIALGDKFYFECSVPLGNIA